MKRLFVILFFVAFLANALAMSEPVYVQTEPEYKVKLYAWTANKGPLINMYEGNADETGLFSRTFFSLTDSMAGFQVIIFDDDEVAVHNERFADIETDKALMIDCKKTSTCTIDIFQEEIESVLEESSTEEESEGESEGIGQIMPGSVVEKNLFNFNFDKTVFILYLVGGILTFAVLMVSFFKFRRLREVLTGFNYLSDEGKLARIRKEIEEKERLIGKMKEKKTIEKKIKKAQERLEKDNQKLERLIKDQIKKENKQR